MWPVSWWEDRPSSKHTNNWELVQVPWRNVRGAMRIKNERPGLERGRGFWGRFTRVILELWYERWTGVNQGHPCSSRRTGLSACAIWSQFLFSRGISAKKKGSFLITLASIGVFSVCTGRGQWCVSHTADWQRHWYSAGKLRRAGLSWVQPHKEAWTALLLVPFGSLLSIRQQTFSGLCLRDSLNEVAVPHCRPCSGSPDRCQPTVSSVFDHGGGEG